LAKRRKIKVIHKKLGKEKAWGQMIFVKGYVPGHIEIDERCKGKKHLEVLVHESIHFLFPRMEEDEVIKKSILLTNTLWHENYRRIDNHDKDELQDGSK
jgi:hypothetical protein